MGYSLAVFDFDGTLVDTSAPILESVRHALVEAGFEAPADAAIRSRIGLSLDLLLVGLAGRRCSPEVVARMCAVYRTRFDEVVAGATQLFDGVAEMLARLAGDGVTVAIATNRGKDSLDKILAAHGLLERFACRVTGSCVPRHKPFPDMLERVLDDCDLDKSSALMVGDTTVDMQMGRAAGVDTCAVTYGAHTEAELRREGPTHVVHRVADLHAVATGREERGAGGLVG